MTQESSPLTAEERATLAELSHRDAMERWQEAEDARLNALAVFAHLDGLVDLPVLLSKLSSVEAATGDIEVKNRVSRLRSVLTYDLGGLLAELERYKAPTPTPVTLPPVEQGESVSES